MTKRLRPGGYHHKYQKWVGVKEPLLIQGGTDTHFMGVFLEKKVKERQAEMERRRVDLFRLKRVGDKYRWCMTHNSTLYRMKASLGEA